jgi:hypothetical protein
MHTSIPKTLSIESMDSTPVSVQKDNFFMEDSPARATRRPVFKSRHTKHKSDSSVESDPPQKYISYHPIVADKVSPPKHSREMLAEMPSSHGPDHSPRPRPSHVPETIRMVNPPHPTYTIQICWCLFDCFHWGVRDGSHVPLSHTMSDPRLAVTTHTSHPPIVQYKPFSMHRSTSSVSPPTNTHEVM